MYFADSRCKHIWFVIVLNYCVYHKYSKQNKQIFQNNHNKQTEKFGKMHNSLQKLVLDSLTSCIFYIKNCSIPKPVIWCNKTHYEEIVENQVFLNDLGLDSSLSPWIPTLWAALNVHKLCKTTLNKFILTKRLNLEFM